MPDPAWPAELAASLAGLVDGPPAARLEPGADGSAGGLEQLHTAGLHPAQPDATLGDMLEAGAGFDSLAFTLILALGASLDGRVFAP